MQSFTVKWELEPVGLDWDGTYKPIAVLDYVSPAIPDDDVKPDHTIESK